MRNVRIFGLLAIIAGALMALAGSASATSITSPTGTALATGSSIHMESEEGAVPGTKKVLLHNDVADIECESTLSATYSHTSAGRPTGNIDSLSFTNCGSWAVTVNALGRLEVHDDGGYNGTVTSYGTKVTASGFGINCVYETNAATGTDIGTITGGSPATLDIIASIPRVGGSFLCGPGNAGWTGNYVTTNAYYID